MEYERTRVRFPPPPKVMMKFDKEMLLYLVCPVTGGQLILSEDREELICRLSSLAYPIVDGVPVLRYDKARDLRDMEIIDDSF